MKSNKSDKKNPIQMFFSECGIYIKAKYPFLILFFVGLLAVSAVNFVKVSTTQTVATFNISNFEVGMISDRDIIADRSIAPDQSYPVAIIKGERIIKKGWPITEEMYAKLQKMAESPLYIDYRAYANSEIFLLLLGIMWYMLFSFIPFHRRVLFREALLQVILFICVFAATAFLGKFSSFAGDYAICVVIPSALSIMLVTILYGNTSAVLCSFAISFGVLIATNMALPPFFFTLAICLSAAGIVRKIERRLDLVFASLLLAILSMVYMLIFIVIFNETFAELPKLLLGVALNGFLSGILTLGFLTPLEVMLNTASVFRLMDLSDLNNPLMRKMLVQASGTYNHSMMVAQLAESACREIDANPLIARVGGYYHDIGKIEQPEYFVENQKGENKHDEISPTLSVSVIKSHVRKGVEKAYQLHLPQIIIDIIAEHHGNSVIAYFYNEAVKNDPNLTPEDFSYPGNPPTSRESAVVMLADTVEAACRTLENPSVPRLEKFITQLVNSKVEHKQLDNCDLTFRDVTRIKEAFVQLLAGYYHSRIEYPEQADPDKNFEKKEIKSVQKTESRTEAKSETKSESKTEQKASKESR